MAGDGALGPSTLLSAMTFSVTLHVFIILPTKTDAVGAFPQIKENRYSSFVNLTDDMKTPKSQVNLQKKRYPARRTPFLVIIGNLLILLQLNIYLYIEERGVKMTTKVFPLYSGLCQNY